MELLNQKKVYNFLNLYSVYLFNKEPIFNKEVSKKQNITFPDGKIVSWKLGIPQKRGPTFTKEFLTSSLAKTKKHFFICNVGGETISQKTGISENKIYSYNIPYIKNLEFSEEEKNKVVSLLKEFKPDYIWVCIGNPKQEILANQLYKKYTSTYFNVGAGLEFLLGEKKEAPNFWRSMGLEWFYRLITDFNYSWKKVWRSFIALKYLKKIKVE